MKRLQFPSLLILPLIMAASVFAQEDGDKKAETYEIKPEPIRIKTKVSGVFESLKSAEVKAATKQIASLTVERAVPRGTAVKKGQPIIWFETEKTDRQIKEAEYNLRLAELAMRDSELAMKQFEVTQKLDKESAERARKSAQQTYDNFVKVDHQRSQLSAMFSLKNSQASLENALEELKQLEKMYKEDELTEESEEIVLKRSRQAVENAKFRFAGSEISTKRSLEQSIPLQLEGVKDELARQELVYDKAIQSLQTAQLRKSIEMDQQKFGFEKQQRDLTQLRDDRKHFVITAPAAGIVYYGQIARGRVSDGKQGPKLTKGSAATNSQILMTIVDPAAMQIRIDLEEQHLHNLGVNDPAIVTPVAFSNRRLNAKIKSVSFVPHAPNKFDCVATVQLGKQAPAIMPGMTCSVDVTVYKKDNALLVPTSAIFTDAHDRQYVLVQKKGQAAKMRYVAVGNKSGEKTEVVNGMKSGESILLNKPA